MIIMIAEIIDSFRHGPPSESLSQLLHKSGEVKWVGGNVKWVL